MNLAKTAAYGTWKSPITSDFIVTGSLRLAASVLDGEDIYWVEGRPAEKGRNVIMCRRRDGTTQELTPPEFNLRTRVHEYGGGAFTVADGVIYFVNFADQAIYRQTADAAPQQLTLAEEPGLLRYADFSVDRDRNRLIAVCEDNRGEGEPTNTIVSISLDGNTTGEVLVSGEDFYANPRISPDGSQLCWISWNHPNMPWDSTQLWVAPINSDGSLGEKTCVAGEKQEESIFQPEWSPDGILYWVSDRSNWWNLYRQENGTIEPVFPMTAEFGLPLWVFGMRTYDFASSHRILCTYTQKGLWYLASLNLERKTLTPISTEYTNFTGIRAHGDRLVALAGSPTQATALVEIDANSGATTVIRRSNGVQIEPGYLSQPQSIAFPTADGATAYGIFYPPQNQDYQGPENEKPPLIVKSHGGPTGATSSSLSLRVQYWTSRGFGFLDVNYRGSTGYGREYRHSLHGKWGVADVDDCAHGAKYLAKQGWVDENRLIITGSSAGGYTTLSALTFRDDFCAGASYYGVSDLEALVRETHKFESRYLDRLVGPYPDQQELYQQRSPIHACDRLSCPVIFFQGLEDKIVPPNQAEMMVNALRDRGLPVAYVAFEGEQHGFRQADNIKRALEAELYFYARVFGFSPADDIEPVEIYNMDV
ncbi:S9 family peptidase [Geitlerinema sp. PCC 9228]|uniref:S9 family peptidase n=1 Tax=Geitlerinema sp. PCC 9228 TaxID=111611 RepID=UPI0008F9DA83|nr:S9 family peptidase [Geitlerinema sp. PCC 9228]